MQKADYLLRLMKQRTDALVASDEKLQQFLMWVSQKSLSVKVPYKPAAIRAFYFALDRGLDRVLSRALDFALGRPLDRVLVPVLDRILDLILDPTLDLDLAPTLDLALDRTLVHALVHAFVRAFDATLVRVLNTLIRALNPALVPKLKQALQELKKQLPDAGSNEIFKQWWKANGQAWIEQLRVVMIEHRNIGHDWQFSKEQKELLKQYYDANKLLVDCLNSSCNVTPAVRSHIEDTLLLPIVEIEQRGSC